MKVLVAYASAHGSTTGIARRIGERMALWGLEVDVVEADDVASLEPYDAVVLGSAVHSSRWLAPARRFIEQHTDQLAGRPLWCFSVCSVGETSSVLGPRITRWVRRTQTEPRDVLTLRSSVTPRDHRCFAGAVEPDHWGWPGRIAMFLMRGTYGDHRDWDDIGAWADRIVAHLPTGFAGDRFVEA